MRPSDDSLAIIAGSGRFPILVAQEAKRQGRRVVGIGVRGWVHPEFATRVDVYHELDIGALGILFERLKRDGVSRVVLAGKVTKQVLLDPAAFDAAGRSLLESAPDFSVQALLGQLGSRLAGEGMTLLDSSSFLQEFLCPAGVLSARPPSAAEREDVALGVRVAQAITPLDIGQTVVVKRRVVIAVEALEGTDAAIRRAHELAGGGLVVVKLGGAAQDRRFDLPVLGLDSIKVCRHSGVTCLALEAGNTLLLERHAVVAAIDAAGLCALGIEPGAANAP